MTPDIIKRAMEVRTKQGLRSEYWIPEQGRFFTVYPKSARQKAAWDAGAAERGWVLQS